MDRTERRKNPRCTTGELATVVCEATFSGRYCVDNLSVGGALLVGDYALPLGATVTLLLEVPGRAALTLSGHVARVTQHRSGKPASGISFDLQTRGIGALRQYVDEQLQAEILEEAIEACAV